MVDPRVAGVVDALKQRGYALAGDADDGWVRLVGNLATPDGQHRCEVHVDPDLFELPRVQVLEIPKGVPKVTPHLLGGGHLCYIARNTVVLDFFDPVGQTLACLVRAGEVLASVLKGGMVQDLEEDFHAYWGGPPCLIDIQGSRLGRQETLVVKNGAGYIGVVTDDQVRTKRKLASIDRKLADYTMLTYRIRTAAKPRPHAVGWPPQTVRDVLAWQAVLDERTRKKIEKKIRDGLERSVKGVLILLESPLMTYGFTVHFNSKKTERVSSRRPTRLAMYDLEVAPVTVMRIDDRYIAERNTPGQVTLAGTSIVLVGCGTIGGYLAEMLVKAGAGTFGGQLTLVDFDTLLPQNIARHRLGFPYLFENKAASLATESIRGAPGANVRALPVDVRHANLGKIDLLIDATGEEALGHWLCSRYLDEAAMVSAWIEGPGTAVRALLRNDPGGACYRCLCDSQRAGLFPTVLGKVPSILAGQGCEGLYVPFPASVSVQAASLAVELVLDWTNGVNTPSLRTRVLDRAFQLGTSDCVPARLEGCPACSS